MRPAGIEPATSGGHAPARLPLRHGREPNPAGAGLPARWRSGRLARVSPVAESVLHKALAFCDGVTGSVVFQHQRTDLLRRPHLLGGPDSADKLKIRRFSRGMLVADIGFHV